MLGGAILLESDRMIFDKSVTVYAKELIKFAQERLNCTVNTIISIETGKKNGKDYVKSIIVKIDNEKYLNYEHSNYSVSAKEKIYPLGKNRIFTKKYSYEVANDNDLKDTVRFDYQIYADFPHLHINADEDTWGNHLTYPDKTNLNLEQLDVIKALNIFQKFIANPDIHILDTENNQPYVSILNGGK